RPPADLEEGPPEVLRLLMVVPLYVYMAVIGGLYFVFVEGHYSGQAVFLHKFTQIPNIYLGIGLYIWAGMMLSRTRLATLLFDVFTPFHLPPALLAWLVVVLAAIPTAYSGASGIFVIAAGAVIFERLRAVGASPRLALAATAMSGSLGVVLRPCLVVVLIAVLNNKVTTDELFGWGVAVFALTAVLSLVAFAWWNKEPVKLAPLGEAGPAAARAFRPLLPYVGLVVGVGFVYYVLFKMTVNEHTAPVILPALMLVLLVYDRLAHAPEQDDWQERIRTSVWPSLRSSTSESSHHVGALLMVMAGSVGLGGVIERAEVMALVPESFGSLFLTITVLVVVMVLVGMTMDALGAVVLVSVTIANVADANGIDPVHFWMVVLVGFELGYLTPPVSLNHLLARQVIGPDSEVEVVDPKDTFWEANEHLLVPMGIMGTALLIVAYGPLFFY
ncbi:MAG: TRAP transporter large permease subunit, partial [Myxococcota bacterium]